MKRDQYVVLHIRPGPPYPGSKSGQHIAAEGPFEITPEFRIEKLDTAFATRIQRACEPAHYKIDNQVCDRHIYAFVHETAQNESRKYESLSSLYTLIALSRLIQPTSTGDRYCARILGRPENDPPIYAIQSIGICPDVFLGDTSRDWLSPHHGNELRKIAQWVPATKLMHPRIHRAFWNYEQALRTYYLDLRWNLGRRFYTCTQRCGRTHPHAPPPHPPGCPQSVGLCVGVDPHTHQMSPLCWRKARLHPREVLAEFLMALRQDVPHRNPCAVQHSIFLRICSVLTGNCLQYSGILLEKLDSIPHRHGTLSSH